MTYKIERKYWLNLIAKECHKTAKSKGWWNSENPPSVLESMALIHSEVSEAVEEYRQHGNLHTYTDHGKPEGIPIELADILIRVFDFCGAHGIDIGEAVHVKMRYNETRSYRHGGKKK